ncbi:MAG: extracellular solute-binding protein [Oscillospiraceae bacterium]|nr:extracellular solute-binding protein [Oscillospiraceae bacterium]
MIKGFGVTIRKIVSAVIMLALCAGIFSGCEGTKKLEEIKLSLWCANDDIPMITQMVEEFKEHYKDEANISVTISAEGEDTCKDTILANPAAAADVFAFAADQFNSLLGAGALLKITENVDAVKTANSASSIEVVTASDGQLYAYPATASNGYFLYYNSNYLTKEDVKSFDRILEVAASNGKKVTMDIGGGWYLYSFFKGAGLDVETTEDGKTNVCNWNTTSGKYTGVDVAEAILRIAEHEGFFAVGDDTFKADAKNGSVIAGISGTWLSNDIKEAFGDGYAAAKLPEYTIKGDSVQMHSFAGYKLIGVSAHTNEPLWSQRLAEWITNEENQLTRFKMRGEGPSNIKAASASEVQASIAIVALSEQSLYGHLQNVADTYWTPTNIFGNTIAAKNMDNIDLQVLLDTMVAGITAAP